GGNRPSTAEINRQRPILTVLPGSDRFAYRSAAGPVCTGQYGSYRSTKDYWSLALSVCKLVCTGVLNMKEEKRKEHFVAEEEVKGKGGKKVSRRKRRKRKKEKEEGRRGGSGGR
ncbi:hypothetical protein BHE74_00049253, partial [Ensete ventricosum]